DRARAAHRAGAAVLPGSRGQRRRAAVRERRGRRRARRAAGTPGMSGPTRMRAALACAAVLGATLAVPARAAEPGDTPAGLSMVWRAPGRKVEHGATGNALNAFSPDGRYVAIHDSRHVRVVDARSGKPVRDFRLDPSSVVPFSLAVSSTG